ncbi:hypothetical protein BXT84_04170 [Sulfobacillus thermotolerans]|uniref:HTH lysR-type domain-containing protein n=1 Tax=Sulfobacillus thermotolerans TaxID=338644 RepID=A0ABN5H033_9FIRM|nr:hypothetical protein BXT84_04170 [Sulfobacillus thermotolerans]
MTVKDVHATMDASFPEMDLFDLHLLVLLAEGHSLAGASRQLNLSPSALSPRLSRLCQRMNLPLQKTSLNLLTGSFRLIVRSLNGFPRQSAVARVRPLTVSHILDKRCDLHNRRWGCPRDLGVALVQDLFNGLFSHPQFDLGIGAPL